MNSDPDFLKASEGIIAPKAVTLDPGTLLFRFASSRRQGSYIETSEDDWYASPKWITGKDFKEIYQQGLGKNTGMSSQRDQRLRRNARNNLALCNRWSDLDILVKAQTRAAIRAYAGEGRPQSTTQEDQTQRTLMMPNQGITQLFLCDIGGTSHLLARAGFQRLSLSGD